MRITDPVLVPDVSFYCDHIHAKEFEDGGCQSVIVGLYSITQNGKQVLNPICRAQCQEVAKTSMVLQTYAWDDITLDPVAQANWVADTIEIEGLPIKWVWADDEQWWLSWTAYYNWRGNPAKYPLSTVPKGLPQNISMHMLAFTQTLRARFPASGVYTNNGFVASWAQPMNSWLPLYKQWVPEYAREPNVITSMTWAQLQAGWMPNYEIALAAGQLPGQVCGHQFTGDVIKLPGAYDQYCNEQVLDVSVFSKAFVDGLRGGVPVPPTPAPTPPQPLYPAYTAIYPLNVRSGASQTSPSLGVMPAGTKVFIDTVTNNYSHFQPTQTFQQGGWLWSAYLKKV